MPRLNVPPSEPHRRRRWAFSIFEVLVALVVVSVGLLGIAGAVGISMRAARAALLERAAVERALDRLSLLSAAGCGAATSGSALAGAGLLERWTVSAPSGGAQMIDAGVEWVDRGASRSLLLRTAVLC
jgi:Tfp pilus assembly protein PilV